MKTAVVSWSMSLPYRISEPANRLTGCDKKACTDSAKGRAEKLTIVTQGKRRPWHA